MLLLRILSNKLNLPLAAILFGLGACALSPFDEEGGFRKVTTYAGVTAPVAEPKDFVKESRPDQQEYPPVGITPPARSVEIRKGQGIKDFETELQAKQQQSVAKATAPVPKSPYDGKIEPGFKPPPLPPLPDGPAPDVGLRGTQPAAAATQPATNLKKSTQQKPNEKKKRTNLEEADH